MIVIIIFSCGLGFLCPCPHSEPLHPQEVLSSSRSVFGAALGTAEAAYTLTWPNPCRYVPLNTAKVRPVSALVALIHSDIL